MQTIATFLATLVVAAGVSAQTPQQPQPQPQPSVTPGEPLVFTPGNARARAVLLPVASVAQVVKKAFSVALADLDGDGKQEVIVKSGDWNCSREGCPVIALQQLGARTVTLGEVYTHSKVVLSREKINGYRALLEVDESGRIAVGTQPNWPRYREPLVHTLEVSPPARQVAEGVLASPRGSDPVALLAAALGLAASANTPTTTPADPPTATAAEPATQPTASAGSIDIVGIRLGMPLTEALAIAKTHNPAMKWHITPPLQFTLMPGQRFTVAVQGVEEARIGNLAYERERITLEAAPGPAPQVVTGILRHLSFEAAQTARDSVLRPLQQKYGSAFDPRSSVEGNRLWLFESDGKPFSHREPCRVDLLYRTGASGGNLGASETYFRSNIQRLEELQREAPRCRTLVAAGWVNLTQNKDLVTSVTVYASDEVLRTARLKAMADHLQRLNQASQRQQTEDAALRPGPKF